MKWTALGLTGENGEKTMDDDGDGDDDDDNDSWHLLSLSWTS